MAPRPYSALKNRDDFFTALARARAGLMARAAADPQYALWPMMIRQLDAMAQWTANGRIPTTEERDRISVGTLVVRELEPIEEIELYKLGQDLHELQYYFQVHYGNESA
ncbi:MAG: hypothetical protein U0326_13110 [Polyangiales bacterium]